MSAELVAATAVAVRLRCDATRAGRRNRHWYGVLLHKLNPAADTHRCHQTCTATVRDESQRRCGARFAVGSGRSGARLLCCARRVGPAELVLAAWVAQIAAHSSNSRAHTSMHRRGIAAARCDAERQSRLRSGGGHCSHGRALARSVSADAVRLVLALPADSPVVGARRCAAAVLEDHAGLRRNPRRPQTTHTDRATHSTGQQPQQGTTRRNSTVRSGCARPAATTGGGGSTHHCDLCHCDSATRCVRARTPFLPSP